MKARIINNNGEVIGEINEGDRIVRKQSSDYLQAYQTWNVQKFYKGHIEEIRLLMKELSTSEKALLFALALYVGYEDCCLKYDNGNELSFDDIVDLSSMSRGIVSQTLNSLIKKDIIYRGRNSKQRQYFVNPWIFCKGQRINKVLKTMFKNYKVRVMNKKWKDI